MTGADVTLTPETVDGEQGYCTDDGFTVRRAMSPKHTWRVFAPDGAETQAHNLAQVRWFIAQHRT